jgi:hypothetical protein
MRRHEIGELPPQNVLEPGVVIDPLRIQELTAGQAPLDQDGSQEPPSGIHGGTQTGGPAPHNDDIQIAAAAHTFSLRCFASRALSKI